MAPAASPSSSFWKPARSGTGSAAWTATAHSATARVRSASGRMRFMNPAPGLLQAERDLAEVADEERPVDLAVGGVVLGDAGVGAVEEHVGLEQAGRVE